MYGTVRLCELLKAKASLCLQLRFFFFEILLPKNTRESLSSKRASITSRHGKVAHCLAAEKAGCRCLSKPPYFSTLHHSIFIFSSSFAVARFALFIRFLSDLARRQALLISWSCRYKFGNNTRRCKHSITLGARRSIYEPPSRPT